MTQLGLKLLTKVVCHGRRFWATYSLQPSRPSRENRLTKRCCAVPGAMVSWLFLRLLNALARRIGHNCDAHWQADIQRVRQKAALVCVYFHTTADRSQVYLSRSNGIAFYDTYCGDLALEAAFAAMPRDTTEVIELRGAFWSKQWLRKSVHARRFDCTLGRVSGSSAGQSFAPTSRYISRCCGQYTICASVGPTVATFRNNLSQLVKLLSV